MLSPATVATLLAFVMASGAMGWRRGTKFVYRRSLAAPDLPSGMTRRDFERRLRRRRKFGRMAVTALYAVIGLALGALFVGITHR